MLNCSQLCLVTGSLNANCTENRVLSSGKGLLLRAGPWLVLSAELWLCPDVWWGGHSDSASEESVNCVSPFGTKHLGHVAVTGAVPSLLAVPEPAG